MRKCKLSSIVQTFSATLYKLTTPFLNGAMLWHHRMPYYAQLIEQKTNGLMDCVRGFIDGTIRKTARPIYHQRSVCTRFKKCHGVKFQSVTVPDSFIAYLRGPWPAQTHDARLLRESQQMKELEGIMPANSAAAVLLYMAIWHMCKAYISLVVFVNHWLDRTKQCLIGT